MKRHIEQLRPRYQAEESSYFLLYLPTWNKTNQSDPEENIEKTLKGAPIEFVGLQNYFICRSQRKKALSD